MTLPIRVVLIEDVVSYAEALRTYIGLSGSGVECCGVFATAETALRSIRKDPPDVAVVDINLPVMSGIELVARLKESCPSVLCLILTTYEDSALIFDALKAGASGYILKRAPAQEIVSSIIQVHQGGSPMSPQIARRVVNFFHHRPPAEDPNVLSEREREVLRLLAEGSMYKEIAGLLNISIDTVRTHVRKIYEKLHVHSRTEAVLKYFGKNC